MAIAITRQEESAAELRRLARASRDMARARRLLAIAERRGGAGTF